eukprot:TRINITY_DN9816_c0_g1_i1.p1 TRINITY_DN9816_c0_g1~~TRINITY_DN9816_c0_g1_i1.p1  ORF type:complete len:1001 (+),score=182.49 TRINITY_DN9816_c0_g1_i1:488-3490(+)
MSDAPPEEAPSAAPAAPAAAAATGGFFARFRKKTATEPPAPSKETAAPAKPEQVDADGGDSLVGDLADYIAASGKEILAGRTKLLALKSHSLRIVNARVKETRRRLLAAGEDEAAVALAVGDPVARKCAQLQEFFGQLPRIRIQGDGAPTDVNLELFQALDTLEFTSVRAVFIRGGDTVRTLVLTTRSALPPGVPQFAGVTNVTIDGCQIDETLWWIMGTPTSVALINHSITNLRPLVFDEAGSGSGDDVTPLEQQRRIWRRGLRELVTSLDVSNNGLTEIPAALQELRCLRRLTFDTNGLTRFPNLRGLTGLESLSAADNQLQSLSHFPQSLPAANLRELRLARNRITSTDGLGWLVQLELLDISNNAIHAWPEIGRLAELKHLASLQLEGNPVQRDMETEPYRSRVLGYFQVHFDQGKDPASFSLDGVASDRSEIARVRQAFQRDFYTPDALVKDEGGHRANSSFGSMSPTSRAWATVGDDDDDDGRDGEGDGDQGDDGLQAAALVSEDGIRVGRKPRKVAAQSPDGERRKKRKAKKTADPSATGEAASQEDASSPLSLAASLSAADSQSFDSGTAPQSKAARLAAAAIVAEERGVKTMQCQIVPSGSGGPIPFACRSALLNFVRTKCNPQLSVLDLKLSFRDGRVLCSLLHCFLPSVIEDGTEAKTDSPAELIERVLRLAHIHLGVPPLLTAEDLRNENESRLTQYLQMFSLRVAMTASARAAKAQAETERLMAELERFRQQRQGHKQKLKALQREVATLADAWEAEHDEQSGAVVEHKLPEITKIPETDPEFLPSVIRLMRSEERGVFTQQLKEQACFTGADCHEWLRDHVVLPCRRLTSLDEAQVVARSLADQLLALGWLRPYRSTWDEEAKLLAKGGSSGPKRTVSPSADVWYYCLRPRNRDEMLSAMDTPEILEAMKDSKGVRVRDIKKDTRVYRSCARGSEFIDWVLRRVAVADASVALDICQGMWQRGQIKSPQKSIKRFFDACDALYYVA